MSDAKVKLDILFQYTTGAAKLAINDCVLMGVFGYSCARNRLWLRFGNRQPSLQHASWHDTCDNVSGEAVARPQTTASHGASNATRPTPLCAACLRPHRLFFCDVFKRMPPQARRDLVVANRLCFNCLLPGHHAGICKKPSICSVPGCGQKHTKFIHIDTATNDQAEAPNTGPVDSVRAEVN